MQSTSTLAADLRGAVDRAEIVAYFQPQVDINSGEIVSAEALCRWDHPVLGLLAPDVFIPLAEETGHIHEIGLFMLDAGCSAAGQWTLDVSVNVSAVQFETDAFLDALEECLTHGQFPPRHLTVEITETRPIVNLAAVADRLSQLRLLGLGISIDDYGTGHSSLAQLNSLPANELKIDKSLVQDASAASRALIGAVVQLAHASALRVVAEGVETEAQLHRARDLGCDRAQGYLTGRAMPRDRFEQVLRAHHAG